MSVIKQITVGGNTYDINDPRVDDIDEVVVVDPSTLTVEEFHTLSEKFLNGNVTILLKVESSTRVMVHTVGYSGTEEYGRWEASALTTSADDDVTFDYAEFDLYKVYYNPVDNTVNFEKETRSYPSGKLYRHIVNIFYDYEQNPIGYALEVYVCFISTDPTPITTFDQYRAICNNKGIFRTYDGYYHGQTTIKYGVSYMYNSGNSIEYSVTHTTASTYPHNRIFLYGVDDSGNTVTLTLTEDEYLSISDVVLEV